jgi:hypothetical protein
MKTFTVVDLDQSTAAEVRALGATAAEHTAKGDHRAAADALYKAGEVYRSAGDAKRAGDAFQAAASSRKAHLAALDAAAGGSFSVENAASMRGTSAATGETATATDGSDLVGYQKYCHDMVHPKHRQAENRPPRRMNS